ncbi:hypothetical protein [Paenibacillus sp. IHBB 10380]|uniref:hypothetical protein n=1 Tax=Paenibacillus sp. IHBB 10380 TaxID=1566358 RepID=UPI0005CFD520|nr:hypothetical protein [Paenibacillus sp. IHBB 10380]AJS58644.1 hypothetical protein UB51_09260 [Paenibacillus sp. IHBB 10380]
MLNKLSKKLLAVGIIVFSLVFSSQAAFAANVPDQEYNDDYYSAQKLVYGDLAVGKINSANDRDWFYVETGANDGGREMTLFLQTKPESSHSIFVINKNFGEPVPYTVLSQGVGNPEWVSFRVEANARYNFIVFKSSLTGYDPNATYYLNPWLF